MVELNQIFIKNLTLLISVGIYEREKHAPQRVIVNLTCDVSIPNSVRRIEDVVSYETAVQIIRNIAEKRHYDLLEELADEIAFALQSEKNIRSIDLYLEKPDIIPYTEGVGIRITRVFPA